MAKYLPKAEKMFQQKLAHLTTPLEYGYVLGRGIDFDICGDVELGEDQYKLKEYHHMYGPFRTDQIAELFFQYGMYLLLIEESDDLPVDSDRGADSAASEGVQSGSDDLRADDHVQSQPENHLSEAESESSSS